MELTSIEKVSWEVFALFGFKGTETISNSLIFVYHLWNNDFEEEEIEKYHEKIRQTIIALQST